MCDALCLCGSPHVPALCLCGSAHVSVLELPERRAVRFSCAATGVNVRRAVVVITQHDVYVLGVGTGRVVGPGRRPAAGHVRRAGLSSWCFVRRLCVVLVRRAVSCGWVHAPCWCSCTRCVSVVRRTCGAGAACATCCLFSLCGDR